MMLASIFHLLASFSRLLAVACWLPHLSSLSVLSLACWLSPAGIRLPPADLRLLASCSRLLAVACWVPPPAGSLSHAGCRLLASTCWLSLFFLILAISQVAPLRVHPHMTLIWWVCSRTKSCQKVDKKLTTSRHTKSFEPHGAAAQLGRVCSRARVTRHSTALQCASHRIN